MVGGVVLLAIAAVISIVGARYWGGPWNGSSRSYIDKPYNSADLAIDKTKARAGDAAAVSNVLNYYLFESPSRQPERQYWIEYAARSGNESAMIELAFELSQQPNGCAEALYWAHMAVSHSNGNRARLNANAILREIRSESRCGSKTQQTTSPR